MADNRVSPRTTAQSSPRSPIAWIKRRARRLQRAFTIQRREALVAARLDWAFFQPGATH